MPYYSRIIPNSFHNRLFPKLFRHNRRMPMTKLGDLDTANLQCLVSTAGLGAWVYGAPEAAHAPNHTPKMDVYSFGVLGVEI